MFDDRTERLRGLLIAHDYVCREIGDTACDYPEEYMNGLREARNRVEQAIIEHRMDVPGQELDDVDIDADKLAEELDED